MKKAFTVVLVILLVVGTVFAKGSSESSSSEKQRTLTIWYEGNEAESFNRLIPEFESAHPDIKIELVNIPYSNLANQELVACQSNAGPDLMWQSNAWVNSFAQMNLLEDLTDTMKKYDNLKNFENEINPVTLVPGKLNDRIYGLPWSTEAMSLVYNKDMFRAAGLDPENPPKTWADMIEYAKKLTVDINGDGIIDQYGFAVCGNNPGNCWFRFVPDLWSAGGEIATVDLKHGNLDTPEGLEALKYYTEFLTKYHVAPENSVNNNSSDNRTLFINKKVAMYIDGQSGVMNVQKETDIDIGICLWPGKNGPTTAGLGGMYVAMPKNAKNKADAWTFLDYFFQPSVQEWFPVAFPVKLEAQKGERFNNYRDKHYAEQLAYTRNFQPLGDTPACQTIVMEMIQSVLSGMTTPEQALKNANEKITAALDL
jgi:multiple sugar transport system substrate-binding protein